MNKVNMKSVLRCQQFLKKYKAPAWTAGLQNIPTHKVQFAQSNTPIERWHLPGVPDGFEVYIKREDLTGGVLTGNKVRCLQFVFADAIQKGYTAVIGAGPTQSNNLRTTAVLATSMGMPAHLITRTNKDPDSCIGNNLIQRTLGVHRYIIPETSDFEGDVWPKMKQLADKIKRETGDKTYPIITGQNPWMFGYVDVFNEMMSQGLDYFTDIVTALAGGGTSSGLIIGNQQTGSKHKIHGMIVGHTAAFQHTEIDQMLKYVGITKSDETFNMFEGPIGAGYGISTPDELDFIQDVAKHTGIILGPVYSGKAAYHLVKQLNTNPQIFKGKKILFMHTGGMFELFDGRMQNAFNDKATLWNELEFE